LNKFARKQWRKKRRDKKKEKLLLMKLKFRLMRRLNLNGAFAKIKHKKIMRNLMKMKNLNLMEMSGWHISMMNNNLLKFLKKLFLILIMISILSFKKVKLKSDMLLLFTKSYKFPLI